MNALSPDLPTFPWLRDMAQRFVPDVGAAEDLAQEVWIRLWRAAPSILPGRGHAWAFRALRNLAINRTRDGKRRRELLIEHGTALHPAPPPAPDAWLERVPEQDVKRILAEISPAHREILRLRHDADLTYAEMADRLGVPVGTVMSRLFRAHEAARRVVTTGARRAG